MLYCYHYDPSTGKYGFAIMRVKRVAGVMTLLGMVAMLLLLKARNTGPTGGAAK
jgi:protein SCO1/2